MPDHGAMTITLDTTELDSFIAEVVAYHRQRPDVGVGSLFMRGSPVFCLVAAPAHGDVKLKLVAELSVRAAFEKLRSKYPAVV